MPKLLALLLAILAAGTGLVGLQNALLNWALPPLLNGQPERLRVEYAWAWMIVPGRVHVSDLRIWSEGRRDEWQVAADSAYGVIDLGGLLERRFQAGDLRAEGVAFAYGPRPDPEPDRARGAPWQVALDGLRAEHVRDVRIGDLRLTGDARVAGSLWIAAPYVDVDLGASIAEMRADLGADPVAQRIRGEASILVEGLDRASGSREALEAISATAKLTADIGDLRFLDFYLADAPWLRFTGAGRIEADVGLDRGGLRAGSTVDASFPALVVRVLTNDVTGAGKAHAEVITGEDGIRISTLAVEFEDFEITPDGRTKPLVEGVGFHIDARSPDIRLDRPFEAVQVAFHLPESRIPDVARYNAYLPEGIGLSLREGAGTVRGRMVASSANSRASGDLHLAGEDVVVQLDDLALTGDIALHANLADAELGTGRYELSGTTVDLRRVGVADASDANRGERLWSASIEVPRGVVQVGAPVYLDASVGMTCSDSAPFVAVFAERTSLPRWARGLLAVDDISAEARLQLGAETLEIAPFQARGGEYQLDLRYRRDGAARDGDLLVQAGPASLGVALGPDGTKLRVLRAKRWFEAAAE